MMSGRSVRLKWGCIKDVLSPFLFAVVVDVVSVLSQWFYADDLVLMCEITDELSKMF